MKKVVLIISILVLHFGLFSQNNNLNNGAVGNYHYVDSLKNQTEIINVNDVIKFTESDVYLNIFYIILFTLFSIFFIKYNAEFKLIFESLFNKNISSQLLSQRNYSFYNLITFLNLIFYLITSYLLFVYLKQFKNFTWYIPLIFLVFQFLYFSIKIFLSKFFTFFDNYDFTKKFSFNIRLTNSISAIVLLAVIFIFTYNPLINTKTLLIISGVIVILLYIIRLYKISSKFLSHPFLFFYLFLYLCTFEIIPFLITIKYINNYFSID